MGIIFPEEYGGSGLGYVEFVIIIEELGIVDPSISLSVAAHNGLCTNHIFRFGNEQQKKKYLPDLVSGKTIGAWGLTESSSGSDAASLKTTAEKKGNKYILNGNKTFTTHGASAKTLVVIAITNKDAGKKGISAFILEQGMPGLIVGKKENKLGHHYTGVLGFVAHGVAALPFWLAMAGLVTAWYLYLQRPDLPERVRGRAGLLYTILVEKYGFDTFNQVVFAGGTRALGSLLWRVGDQRVIDGWLVNGSARAVGLLSGVVRRLQSGYLYQYAFAMIVGLVALLGWFVRG